VRTGIRVEVSKFCGIGAGTGVLKPAAAGAVSESKKGDSAHLYHQERVHKGASQTCHTKHIIFTKTLC